MTALDRSYTYVAKTFDSPGVDPAGFADVMSRAALPVWRRLHEGGLVSDVLSLHKVGDIDLHTSTASVRDWRYFVLVELCETITADAVIAAEQDAGLDADALAASGIQYLSNEVLVRPAGAGTAIPVPSPHWPAPPPNHLAGVEYIYIPDDNIDEYRRFMKDVMGPVGRHLVASGHSFQIQIMERTQVLRHDPSLPEWNRIHLLWGDFDDRKDGFIEHSTRIVRELFGAEGDVRSVLALTVRYRLKPRMSKNRILPELCVGSRYTG